MKRSLFLMILLALLASCTGTNGLVRKCDGRRGTQVPMGVM